MVNDMCILMFIYGWGNPTLNPLNYSWVACRSQLESGLLIGNHLLQNCWITLLLIIPDWMVSRPLMQNTCKPNWTKQKQNQTKTKSKQNHLINHPKGRLQDVTHVPHGVTELRSLFLHSWWLLKAPSNKKEINMKTNGV